MDRETTFRTLAAVGLSIAVMMAWAYLFGPQPGTLPPPTGMEAGAAAAQDQGPADPAASRQEPVAAADADKNPDAVADAGRWEKIEGTSGQANVEVFTSSRQIVFSARGGRLLSWKLLDYEQLPGSADGRPVDLVSPQARALDHDPLYVEVSDKDLEKTINEAWYQVSEGAADDDEREAFGLPEGTRRVAFRWADGAGLEVDKTLYIPDDGGFLAWLKWDVRRQGRSLDDAVICWGPGISRANPGDEKNRYAYRGRAIAALTSGIERYSPGKVDADISWPAALAPRWLALDAQHFAVAMVPRQPGVGMVRRYDLTGLGESAEEQNLALATGAREVVIFGGPKEDHLLKTLDKRLGVDLTSLVNWGFFGFLARPLYFALAWLERGVGNWGLAIIIITIVIKVIFYPLTQKSMVNMRRTQQQMAKLQPKVRKIKEKYRDKRDMEARRKMNEEMMALYSREGVNPMASLTGCMPMLLQLPVLYAMYTVLSAATELRGAPFFGWIHDLSAPDPYLVTPLVMGVTMLGQQLLTLTKTEDPQQKSQQRMMLMMPIMFTFFFLRLPSGLVLYWLVNNVLGIGQQVLINRHAERATE
ncbi:MAG: membrane protein insertase YidC [Acidobacteriota bacterium]|nr:membrane protein insertase YidC [Acidobacteriota bacterium]MDQ7087472.1 membrane protein insertase YidC [Acidobacteriota bacterium]